MPKFAICRTKKLKQRGSISGMGSHVERTRETLNANPDAKNYPLKNGGKMLESYDARMEELAIPKIRKNAVLAVDFMLSASPDFFLTEGKTDNQKVGDFAKQCRDWLQEKWGDNFVSATLHMDEKTPHIHALIIPEKDGKLNARHFFGGREKMQELQDDFYAAVENLGLDRGIKGSKATHQSIQKYYSQVNQVEALTDQLGEAKAAIVKQGELIDDLGIQVGELENKVVSDRVTDGLGNLDNWKGRQSESRPEEGVFSPKT